MLCPSTGAVSSFPTSEYPTATLTEGNWDRRQERSAPEITVELLFKSFKDKFPDKCYRSLFPSRFWPSRWGPALHAGDPRGLIRACRQEPCRSLFHAALATPTLPAAARHVSTATGRILS